MRFTGTKAALGIKRHAGLVSRRALLLLLLAASGLFAAHPGARAQSAVPAALQPLYSYLNTVLDDTKTYVDAHQPGNPTPITFGAELLTANGNRGQALLDPQNLQGTFLNLDRLQQLGVQGVTIAVKFPLYTPSDPHFQDYRNYYMQVANEIHQRGMKLDGEATVLFAGTPFTNEGVSFAGLTLAQFEQQDRQMVQDIIADLSPDYLMLIDEPSTEAALTGIKALNDAATELQFVNGLLDGLDRGTTLVGAGAGSWESPDFVAMLAAGTSLDYIGIHIYPLSGTTIRNALTMAADAHQNGKRVLIEEAWLYKAGPQEQASNVAANTTIFQRDGYSFFAPLDQEFLHDLARLAHMMGAEYISPFWSDFFFGYVDCTDATAALPYGQLTAMENQLQYANMQAGTFSDTGLYYGSLICAETACSGGQ